MTRGAQSLGPQWKSKAPWGFQCWHRSWDGSMLLGSLISSSEPQPRATLSPLPAPGRLAMIVTEYMENGSLDAFLRVRVPPLPLAWAWGGRSSLGFWELVQSPLTLLPGLDTTGWGVGGRYREEVFAVSQSNCLSAPIA